MHRLLQASLPPHSCVHRRHDLWFHICSAKYYRENMIIATLITNVVIQGESSPLSAQSPKNFITILHLLSTELNQYLSRFM